jgi:hypothetical protein
MFSALSLAGSEGAFTSWVEGSAFSTGTAILAGLVTKNVSSASGK